MPDTDPAHVRFSSAHVRYRSVIASDLGVRVDTDLGWSSVVAIDPEGCRKYAANLEAVAAWLDEHPEVVARWAEMDGEKAPEPLGWMVLSPHHVEMVYPSRETAVAEYERTRTYVDPDAVLAVLYPADAAPLPPASDEVGEPTPAAFVDGYVALLRTEAERLDRQAARADVAHALTNGIHYAADFLDGFHGATTADRKVRGLPTGDEQPDRLVTCGCVEGDCLECRDVDAAGDDEWTAEGRATAGLDYNDDDHFALDALDADERGGEGS